MDETLILELSSDEEVGIENSSSADNFDWITNLLKDDPPDWNSIDPIYDDDVVVVGEVIVKKPKSLVDNDKNNVVNDDDDDDDDDCVVLDGDPDKAKDEGVKDCNYENINDKIIGNCEKDDGDDLVVVGEKGQVACRDFPHARHSCAKYPFSSTAHESSCDLCHCYVCDSLAPCAHWGSGVLSTDHCHATDKEEYWKRERTRFREQRNPSPLPVAIAKCSDGSLPQSSQLQQICRGPNQLLRSSPYYSRYTNRRHRPSVTLATNKFQPDLISRQLRRCVNNNNTQIQGNRGASVLPRTRVVSSRPFFKRSGVTGRTVAAEYQPAYHSQNNVSVACLRMPNQHLTEQHTEHNSTNSTLSSLHSELNPTSLPSSANSMYPGTFINLQGYSTSSVHTPTSQYHGYNHSAGLASDNNPSTYAPVNQSQNLPDLAVPLYSEQHSAVMQNISGTTPNGLSSITQHSHQNSAEQSCFSPVSTMINAWNSLTPSCQQSPVESSVVQGAVPMHELLPSIEQNKPPSTEQNKPPSIEQNKPPSDDASGLPSFFDMDYWLQDDGPILGSREESFLFDVTNQASGPEQVDAGMLYFDFETSMKGLTHL